MRILYTFLVLSAFAIQIGTGCWAAESNALQKKNFKELQTFLKLPALDQDLSKGALLISREEFPKLNIQAELAKIAALGNQLRNKLPEAGTVSERVGLLCALLFEKQGYVLPEKEDASAILLSEVMKHKHGNCLGLTTLAIAIAERAGLPVYGVPIPSRKTEAGHVFLRCDFGGKHLNVEMTRSGKILEDDFYIKKFELTQQDLKNGYTMARISIPNLLNLQLVNLAGARILDGRPSEAYPLLDLAESIRKDYAPTFINRGAAALHLGDWNQAAAAYEKAIQLEPRHVSALLGLTRVALKKNDVKSAEGYVQKALEEEPESFEAQSLLANVYLSKKEYRMATAILSELADQDTENAIVRSNLGLAHRYAGNISESIVYYQEALTLDPMYAEAYLGLAETFRAAGQPEKAKLCLENAKKVNPNQTEILLVEGRAALHAGDFKRAERQFKTVLKEQPHNLEALQGWVDALGKQKRIKEALVDLNRTLLKNPDDTVFAIFFGDTLLKVKDYRQAHKILKPVLAKQKGQSSAIRFPVLQRLATCELKLRLYRPALAKAKEALKHDPADLICLQIAGHASAALRDKKSAAMYYKKVLELSPGHPEATKGLQRIGIR